MHAHVCVYLHKLNDTLLSFQWVQEEYKVDGWTRHHDHLLEYDEPDAENAKPTISARVAEPADGDEKNWKVSIIGTSQVSYTILPIFIKYEFLLCTITTMTFPISHPACVFVAVQKGSCG